MLSVEPCVVDRTGLSDEQYIETLQSIVEILDQQTATLLEDNSILAKAMTDIVAELENSPPWENTESSNFVFNTAARSLEEIGYEV